MPTRQAPSQRPLTIPKICSQAVGAERLSKQLLRDPPVFFLGPAALASVSPLYHQLCVCLSVSFLGNPPNLSPRLSKDLYICSGMGDEGSSVSVSVLGVSVSCVSPSFSLYLCVSLSLDNLSISVSVCMSVSISLILTLALNLSFFLSLSLSPPPPTPSLGTSVLAFVSPPLSLSAPAPCPWVSAFLSLFPAPPPHCPDFS